MFSAVVRAFVAVLLPAAGLAQAIPVTGDPVPALAAFDQVMLTNMAKHGIPGATLGVARDGRLVYLRGFGYSDKDAGTPVQPDALFRLASVTKPITATAIVKLIEQGKLTLGSKAFTILSSLQPPAGSTVDPRLAQITVQQLLEHKAGWDNAQIGFDPMFTEVAAAQALGVTPPATCEVVIRYMMGKPLSYTPGTAASYSNFGYCVLGRIVEQISGQTLDAFVQTQIMAPTGAANTRVGGTLLSEKFAGEVNYYMEGGPGLAPSVFPPHSLVPWPYGGYYLQAHNGDGGMVSNTQDLLKYLNSMAGFRMPSAILSSPPAGFVGYIPPRGLGWGWTFHGSLPGNQSSLFLDNRTTFCWLTNIRHNDMALNNVLFSDFDGGLANAAKAISNWPSGDLFSGTPVCAYVLNPASAAFGPTGGSASVTVATSSNCAWTATSNAPWVTIAAGASGSGNGSVSYTVQPNTTASSRVDNLFAGLAEAIPGLLLFFRRTALLGALLGAAAMANVVALNVFYDVPVKIFSTHLLLFAGIIAAPDLRRLARVFLFNEPAPPADLRPALNAPRVVRAWQFAKAALIVVLIGFSAKMGLGQRAEFERGVQGDPYGVYAVEPRTVWAEVVFGRSYRGEGMARVRETAGDLRRFGYSVDEKSVTFRSPEGAYRLEMRKPEPGLLELGGTIDGKPVAMKLRKRSGGMLLETRGFHWVNEFPFNR